MMILLTYLKMMLTIPKEKYKKDSKYSLLDNPLKYLKEYNCESCDTCSKNANFNFLHSMTLMILVNTK